MSDLVTGASATRQLDTRATDSFIHWNQSTHPGSRSPGTSSQTYFHHPDTHPSGSLWTASPRWLTSFRSRKSLPREQTSHLYSHRIYGGSMEFRRTWYPTDMEDSPPHFNPSCNAYWESNSKCQQASTPRLMARQSESTKPWRSTSGHTPTSNRQPGMRCYQWPNTRTTTRSPQPPTSRPSTRTTVSTPRPHSQPVINPKTRHPGTLSAG